MEQIKQQLDWRFIPKVLTPSILLAIFIIVFNSGRSLEQIKALTFDSPEQKAEVLKVADSHLSEIEIYKGFERIRELEDRQAAIKSDIEAIKISLKLIEKQTK